MRDLPRGWSHARDEQGIQHDVCGVVVPLSPDATLDQAMRAVGTHLGKCAERHPPKRAFQDQPSEPGYYWARCNEHGWMVEKIGDDGFASNDCPIAEWGPRIPDPKTLERWRMIAENTHPDWDSPPIGAPT